MSNLGILKLQPNLPHSNSRQTNNLALLAEATEEVKNL